MRFLRVVLVAALAASVALAGVHAQANEDLSLESVLSNAGLSTHPTVTEDELHHADSNGMDFALLEHEVNDGLKNEHHGEGEGESEAEHEAEAEHEVSVDAHTHAKIQQEAEHEALQEVDIAADLEKELNEGLENAVQTVDDVNLIQTSDKAQTKQQTETEAEAETEQEGEAEAEQEVEGEAEVDADAEAEVEGEAEVDAEAEAEIEPALLQKDQSITDALKKVDEADEVVSLVEQQSAAAMKSIAQMEHEARMNHLRAAHHVQMQRHSELLEKHKQLLAKHEKEHGDLLRQQEQALIQQAEELHLNNPDILLDPLLKVKSADEKIEIQSALKQVGLDDQSEAEREMNEHLALLEQSHKATIAANVAAARNAQKPTDADRQRVLAEREHARQAKLQAFENRDYIPAQDRAEHDAAHADQDEADYLASRIHK